MRTVGVAAMIARSNKDQFVHVSARVLEYSTRRREGRGERKKEKESVKASPNCAAVNRESLHRSGWMDKQVHRVTVC